MNLKAFTNYFRRGGDELTIDYYRKFSQVDNQFRLGRYWNFITSTWVATHALEFT
jgi:hypothetical protein